MKKSLTYLASAALLSATMFTVGCGETEGVKTETEIKGPGGSATITEEKKVETSGEAPPVVPVEKPATP
ncbi:hypothetical protein [Paludisphaera soli]|uniref:hypothetical protein n=1 Tax=Paludisphaera soli TaxID=2712865 RepID=UPI0013EBB7D0|nr:hypothetical protein [Paludisphaera soli]